MSRIIQEKYIGGIFTFSQRLTGRLMLKNRPTIAATVFTTVLFASDKTRITIQNIETESGADLTTDATVTDLLSSELVSFHGSDVVDGKDTDTIIKEQVLKQGACTDQACAVKLGNLLNLHKILVGSLSKLGSKYLITVNFVDVERSQFTTVLFASDKTGITIQNTKTRKVADPVATVTDLLTSQLVSLRSFDVVDGKNTETTMKEQALQEDGCTPQTSASKLGNFLKMQKIVVGSLSKLGSKYHITVNFVDVERSQVELSEKITADGEETSFSSIQTLQTLTKKLAPRVGILGRIIEIRANGRILIDLGKDDNRKIFELLIPTNFVGVI